MLWSNTSVRSSLLSTHPSMTQQVVARYNSTNSNTSNLYNITNLLGETDNNNPSQLQQTLGIMRKPSSAQQESKGLFKNGYEIVTTPTKVAENLKTTGPIAGRIVHVQNGDISTGFRKLKTLVNINSIRFESQQQRFHKKPGKVLEEKRIRRKKKLFNEGVKRLMNLVKEAKRRGY